MGCWTAAQWGVCPQHYYCLETGKEKAKLMHKMVNRKAINRKKKKKKREYASLMFGFFFIEVVDGF